MVDKMLPNITLLIHMIIHGGSTILALLLCMSSVVFKKAQQGTIGISDGQNKAIDKVTLHPSGARALIVGAGHIGHMLAEGLEKDGLYQVVGFLDDDGDSVNTENHYQILGARSDIKRVINEYEIDEVVVAYAPTWQEEMVGLLMRDHNDVKVRVVPTSYESLISPLNMQSIKDIALVTLAPETRIGREVLKRCCDFLFALTVGLMLLPIGLLCMLLIKVTSPGPVILQQERIGYKNRAFKLHKFRTMIKDAEETTGEVKSQGLNDPRITRIGKVLRALRLDELPQLWDVLRGEMSIVGPRPERPGFVKVYQERTPIYAMRHLVRPGITGLAQICGGYHTDSRDKLRFDLFYVSHLSVGLDLSILMRTIFVVLRLQGR